jgi:hypothetical protein
MTDPKWLEEIRERWQFHDQSFKASKIEPDQEHHDLKALLSVIDKYGEALTKANQFMTNGIEYGYITIPDECVSARETPGIVREALSFKPEGGRDE